MHGQYWYIRYLTCVKLCIQVLSPCRPRLTPTGCSSTGCSAFERCDQIIVNVLHCVNILEMTNYCCDGRRHSLFSQEREELYSRAIWLRQSCDKCLSTNHKVLDSVCLLFHCSCTQVLQYIALSIAALGNNVFTISTGKNYPVPETITLQLTDTEKCQHLLLWLTVIFHPIFQISSPQDWAAWASVTIVSGGLGMRTFYCIRDKLYSTHTVNTIFFLFTATVFSFTYLFSI